MYRHPLDGVWAKLMHAEFQADALKFKVGQFLGDNPYRVVSEEDPETGDCLLRAQVLKAPPILEWGVEIGAMLHNLRSALDHLTWQLALAYRPDADPPPRTEFPIFIDPDLFQAERAKKIGGLDPRAQERIESVQPYRRTDRPETDPLWYLHELNRTDKHRVLHVVSAAIPSVSYTLDVWLDFGFQEPPLFGGISTFEHDDVLLRWPNVPRCAEIANKLKLSFGVAFDPEGPARGWPVDNALEWWGPWIADKLLPQFVEFFPAESKEPTQF